MDYRSRLTIPDYHFSGASVPSGQNSVRSQKAVPDGSLVSEKFLGLYPFLTGGPDAIRAKMDDTRDPLITEHLR
jgi:hypothetical protein